MNKNIKKILEKKLFIFDIEGVLIDNIDTPSHPVDSAVLFIELLRKRGKKIRLISNITRKSSKYVSSVLKKVGFGIYLDEIITTSVCTAIWINSVWQSKERKPRAFCITEGGIAVDLRERGIEVTDERPIDFVVVGMKRNLTYREINLATTFVLEGATLISAGNTRFYKGRFRGEDGLFLGDVPICAAIQEATGRKPIKVGKPDPFIYKIALQKDKVGSAVFFGDKIETDIAGAKKLGILSVLISREEEKKDKRHFAPPILYGRVKPDIIINNYEIFLPHLTNSL